VWRDAFASWPRSEESKRSHRPVNVHKVTRLGTSRARLERSARGGGLAELFGRALDGRVRASRWAANSGPGHIVATIAELLSATRARTLTLSSEIGLCVQKAFCLKMDTLMREQSAYTSRKTRKRQKKVNVRRTRNTADIAS
jgi:hypothetical protein